MDVELNGRFERGFIPLLSISEEIVSSKLRLFDNLPTYLLRFLRSGKAR